MKFLEDELKAIYQAEQVLTKALYKIIESADSLEFLTAIENHLKETEGHIEKVERAFEVLAEKVIARILSDIESGITTSFQSKQESQTKKSDEAMDDALPFKTLRAFSKILGLHEIVHFLEEISDKKNTVQKPEQRVEMGMKYAPEPKLLQEAYFLN